jgi:hypothetical protein
MDTKQTQGADAARDGRRSQSGETAAPRADSMPHAKPDHGESSASTLVEAPQRRGRKPLDPHDFPDGGGSGGAEAYSRKRVKR